MEILIGGDVYLGNDAEKVSIDNPSILWGDAINLLERCDLSIINLESPITHHTQGIVKTGPNIKASPKVINALNHANIDLVTLANNHIMDFGEIGLKHTIDTCDNNNIDYVGAGTLLSEAQAIWYKEITGKKLGIVNFAENEWSSATSKKGGANPMDLIDNTKQIQEAKSNSDFVIVIIHGGHEYYSYPSPRMVKQYRYYADQGADVVVAHHTHCVSGYEVHNNTPIFYSLGNLLFPSDTNFEQWYKGVFLKLIFNENITFELIPFYQFKDTKGIKLMTTDEKKDFMQTVIDPINQVISDPEKLEHQWQSLLNDVYQSRLLDISGKKNLIYRFLKKVGLLMPFMKKSQLNLLLNLIRCESHKDLSIGVLEKINEDS